VYDKRYHNTVDIANSTHIIDYSIVKETFEDMLHGYLIGNAMDEEQQAMALQRIYFPDSDRNISIIITMFDCHYYFKPDFWLKCGNIYVQGANFYPVCGTYELPFHDGNYTLTHENKIIYTTCGGMEKYEHDNMTWLNP